MTMILTITAEEVAVKALEFLARKLAERGCARVYDLHVTTDPAIDAPAPADPVAQIRAEIEGVQAAWGGGSDVTTTCGR